VDDFSYYKLVEGYGTFKEGRPGIWELQNLEHIAEFGDITVNMPSALEVEWPASEV
jgi:hypothetical protein